MTRDQMADRVVHVVGIGLGTAAAVTLVLVAAINGKPGDLIPILIYATGLVAMLGCSAAYNVFHTSVRRDWLRRFDHAAIFAMIAGTYTPFTTRLAGGWAVGLTAAIWTVAAAGIALKLWQPRRIETISIVLYLALGWIGLIAVGPFRTALDTGTLFLLALGGIVYTAGVVFHLWHRLPYQNAVWHGFVLVAASVHYVAVIGLIVDA